MFHILTADNDRAYRRRLQQILKREGYSVVSAVDGEEVLRIMETEYIDLIILGTNLAGADVYELVTQLRDT